MRPENICCPISMESSEADGLANLLTQAYFDEPHFRYIMPDEQSRLRLLPALFREAVRATQLYGEIHTTHRLDGGALWIGPESGLTIRRTMWSAFPSIRHQFSFASLRRCLRLGRQLDEVHQRLVRGPHWHLLALGIKPSAPRERLGCTLIDPVLARADSDSLPCYFETFNEKDLPFYARRGFRIAGGGKIARGGPDFWALIRARRA